MVAGETSGIRRMGSAALDLAYVAAGRYDAFWEFALSPWDIAAGLVILREAGGIVTEVDGRDQMMSSGDILASNGELHNDLRNLLAKAADSSAK
jgi:myo-inositol-1(or 4)-monophosphatase